LILLILASFAISDELLSAIDVVGRAREGRVGHDVYSERGDVGWSDDAPDGKRGAKLIAPVFEFIAEERRRQRCVDETGGDDVDSDGRELKRKVFRHGGLCGRESRDQREPRRRAAAAVPLKKIRVPPKRILRAAFRATCIGSKRWASMSRRAFSMSNSASGA
jgi:hypothetical protein